VAFVGAGEGEAEDTDNELFAIVPSYIKTHSWGEFVFDWDWAQAFEQHGCPYYPKLVSTIPFTPISSNKLLSNKLLSAGLDPRDMVDGMIELCLAQSLNSWHYFFELPRTAQFVQVGNPVSPLLANKIAGVVFNIFSKNSK
jgi:predicted N-acyltransferase